MIDAPTRHQVAAADLAARIALSAAIGDLAGVRADVQARGGRVLLTVLALPPGSSALTPEGLAPTPLGARITQRLHLLARRCAEAAGLKRPTIIRISPAVLLASAGNPGSQVS